MLYLLTLSRYSLFQNSLKRVLQSLNPDPKFRAIPRVIFGIPPPKHTLNPESCFDFAFKSRIPSFKSVKEILVTEKNLLGTLLEVWFIPPQFCTDFDG